MGERLSEHTCTIHVCTRIEERSVAIEVKSWLAELARRLALEPVLRERSNSLLVTQKVHSWLFIAAKRIFFEAPLVRWRHP